ncbi:MAG: protein translocase subunit SecF, partial [Candidatus Omnitrophica bacterium]|nr:protein translocase subunit SecF [Candidatus Omnitrophota bacterium]
EMEPGNIIKKFKETFANNNFDILKVENVGPSVGRDLRSKAIKALLLSFVCMMIYISFRFEFRFAFGGILALVHDVLVTIAVLAMTNREISTSVIAALLTIVGYSINDTIVIFDRIRENMKILRKVSFNDLVNISINETLSRTIFTSFTVFEVLLALYFLGGEVINDFAFTMLVGCISGTYSTIFIAVPVLVEFQSSRRAKK